MKTQSILFIHPEYTKIENGCMKNSDYHVVSHYMIVKGNLIKKVQRVTY